MRRSIRLLQTADWHWGRVSWKDSPRAVDRNPEIRRALEEIYDYSYKNKPDCILICGDIFDHYVAPSEIEAKEVLSLIIDFSKIAPVVIVLGNHDWRGLATYHPFSSRMGIHILSSLCESPFEEIDGLRIFYFPYFPLRNLLKKYRASELQDQARKLLSDYKNELKKFAKLDRWNILVGHLSVEGLPYQNEITILSELFVPKDFLSSEVFDYVALGHVHSQMKVPGTSVPSYYCGGLIRIGFKEEGNLVGALWVEIEEGSEVKVEPIKITSKELKTLKVLASDLDVLKDMLESLKEDAYIRVELDMSKGPFFSSSFYINRVFSMDERIVKVKLDRGDREDQRSVRISKSGDLVEMFREYLKLKGVEDRSLLERFRYYFRKVEEEDEAS
ncbi:MAG: metallophosphoesterase [Synergistetes bacterium]|nr:metallophosphoesterase [Synergistota bacterium]MCX8127158.1 metallophosphoesterase [Synergistota bacterium]MDW8191956.1 metallophosphoesterase [Synergistota bacterium]